MVAVLVLCFFFVTSSHLCEWQMHTHVSFDSTYQFNYLNFKKTLTCKRKVVSKGWLATLAGFLTMMYSLTRFFGTISIVVVSSAPVIMTKFQVKHIKITRVIFKSHHITSVTVHSLILSLTQDEHFNKHNSPRQQRLINALCY